MLVREWVESLLGRSGDQSVECYRHWHTSCWMHLRDLYPGFFGRLFFVMPM